MSGLLRYSITWNQFTHLGTQFFSNYKYIFSNYKYAVSVTILKVPKIQSFSETEMKGVLSTHFRIHLSLTDVLLRPSTDSGRQTQCESMSTLGNLANCMLGCFNKGSSR